jgi:hypothetical protein
MTGLKYTMEGHWWHPWLNTRLQSIIGTCDACQRLKAGSKAYGHLLPREALVAPWYEIQVDLVGPWKITVQGMDLYFNALTIIDPVTNLVEIIRITDKTARHVRMQLENNWL